MTPRERALAAFRHEVPDRVPAYVRNVMDWERHAKHFGVLTQEELFAVLGNTIRSFWPDPDTGEDCREGEPGMIQIHDLANTGSIAVILTADLGRRVADGFEVLGRRPGAEARGCSIAADEMLGTLLDIRE